MHCGRSPKTRPREKGADKKQNKQLVFGLEKRANFNVTKLSGGEKQRVAILRAIINKPQCVLADEPTGNLCQSTADQVYSSLLKLKEEFGMSIVIVTHDIRLANKMDAIYQLTDGKIEKK